MTVKRIQTLANDAAVQQFPSYVADSYLKRNVGNTGWEFLTLTNVGITQVTVTISSNGQTSFTLPSTPISGTSVQMYLNGQKMTYTSEYTVSGTTVTYIPGPSVLTTDVLEFSYLVGSGGIAMGQASVISPTSIGASQNNYAPTGFATADILRITASGAFSITGIIAETTSTRKKIINIGSNIITLTHQDVLSTAANRIIIPGAVSLSLLADDSVDLFYDTTTARWRVV